MIFMLFVCFNQRRGTELSINTPHCPGPSSPFAKRMYPYSPQSFPHEFLHFQKSFPSKFPYPANKIP